MTGRLDPLAASDQITSTYHRYVKTLVDVSDRKLAAAFATAVDHGEKLTKGPLLEATAAYTPGLPLRELIREGVLAREFVSLASDSLPLDRPLYQHQEEAIRKVVAGRNVVVTTGTGSGKTESFLIPILNHLVKERAAGTLGPGVRALLLYPMNALANDQVKRLRNLLAGQRDITFGRYTGETKESARDAENQHRALHKGEARLPNELLSREEMRATPPNILLTNYAMLEYLLLRPLDLDLFSSSAWKFVALDEAHVYDGAKGAEIAMLLRRLHDRVAAGSALQCIATSASLTGERDTVMNFATSLFGAEFTWRSDVSVQQDLVVASRLSAPDRSSWGPLTADEVAEIAGAADAEVAVLEIARRHGENVGTAADVLNHEDSVVKLRQRLARSPLSVSDLAASLWPGAQNPRRTLDQLVAVASALRDGYGNPLLSARYHLFVRATEGAFTCLSDTGPHVQLGRHEECPDCAAACFEFGACQRCGTVYLAGQLDRRGSDLFFVPPTDPDRATTWVMLGDGEDQADEDEETLGAEDKAEASKAARLCPNCGLLDSGDAMVCHNCAGATLRAVKRYEKPRKTMGTCAHCGAKAREVVRRLNTGPMPRPQS